MTHTDVLVFNQQALAASGRSGVLAGAEIHYGLIPNLEVDIGMPYAFNLPTGGSAQRGYGDTTLEIKYRLLSRRRDATGQLCSETQSIDRKCESRARQRGQSAFHGLALQKSNDKFQMNGNGGYWINNGPDNRSYWFLGWQAQYAFTSHWQLGIEIFHTSPQVVGQGPSTRLQRRRILSHLDSKTRFFFSAGRGLQNAAETNRVSTYLGYRSHSHTNRQAIAQSPLVSTARRRPAWHQPVAKPRGNDRRTRRNAS